MPTKFFDAEMKALEADGPPRYEQIAQTIESAVLSGKLRRGSPVPTVRRLAVQFGVSVTTIMPLLSFCVSAAWSCREWGAGLSFPNRRSRPREAGGAIAAGGSHTPVRKCPRPWRRRMLNMLNSSGTRAGAAYPKAVEARTGRSDAAPLPFPVIALRLGSGPQEISLRNSFNTALRSLFHAWLIRWRPGWIPMVYRRGEKI